MSLNTEKFYNNIASLYPVIDFFLKPQKRKFFDEINKLPHGNLLEIGVGNGSCFNYYKKHQITGIDSSKSMLRKAEKHINSDVKLFEMKGENLEFEENTFDYVALSHVISVVQDSEKLFMEIYRVLKPGGMLYILNHFTPNNALKYLDKAFEKVSNTLHFRSVFEMEKINKAKKFTLINQVDVGLFDYFKILTFQKT